jgi:hypothetical protein
MTEQVLSRVFTPLLALIRSADDPAQLIEYKVGDRGVFAARSNSRISNACDFGGSCAR